MVTYKVVKLLINIRVTITTIDIVKLALTFSYARKLRTKKKWDVARVVVVVGSDYRCYSLTEIPHARAIIVVSGSSERTLSLST